VFVLGLKDAGISPDKHALIIPPFMSRGKKVHPVPFPDSAMSCKFFWAFEIFLCVVCFNFLSLLIFGAQCYEINL